ncbi:MAG: class I SAM-dependent methyltransferase, partial [Smithella sp.]
MFEKFWGQEKEEFSDRDPDTLVGWPENYPYIADCHSVIDIGCGIGNVVEWLNKRGHNAIGITCQDKEVQKGISLKRTIMKGDMHDIPLLPGKDLFDAFTMWDSL